MEGYRRCDWCDQEFVIYDEDDRLCDDCLAEKAAEEEQMKECWACGEWFHPENNEEVCPSCQAYEDYEASSGDVDGSDYGYGVQND